MFNVLELKLSGKNVPYLTLKKAYFHFVINVIEEMGEVWRNCELHVVFENALYHIKAAKYQASVLGT